MAQISPLAMLLSGIGSRGDVMPATDDQGNLVLVPKPGAGAQLPGGARALPQQAPAANGFVQPAPGTPVNPNAMYAAGGPPAAAPAPPASAPAIVPGAPPAAPVQPGAQPNFGALPNAPVYTPPDMERRNAMEAMVAQHSKPTDPKDPSVKAHWYDRLLGGLVGFGRGYVHDPNAMAEGGAVTNRRYNTAEYTRKQALEGDKEKLDAFDRGTRSQHEQFQDKNDVFKDELERAQEERMRFDTTSKAGERSAKADKYDNTVDPSTIKQDKDGNWYGTTYGGERKETGAPKGYKDPNSDNDPEHVIMQNTPADKKVDVARRLFNQKHPGRAAADGEKPETPATRLRRSKEVNDAGDARTKALNELENGNAAKGVSGFKQAMKRIQNDPKLTDQVKQKEIDNLAEAHRQAKQEVEDEYASKLGNLGKDYQKVIYNKDGSFTREGQNNNGGGKQLSRDEAADYLKRAGGDKEKARKMARDDGRSF
jgi:hypothetical protein